jgi:hypothetical protein
MAEFGKMKTLELWYYALGADELVAGIKDPAFRRRGIARLQKERGRSIAEDVFPKLAEHKADKPLIKDQLPTIFHLEGHPPGDEVRPRPFRAPRRRRQGRRHRQRRHDVLGAAVHGA